MMVGVTRQRDGSMLDSLKGGRGPQEWSKKHYFIKELKREALSKLKAPELSASDIENPRRQEAKDFEP